MKKFIALALVTLGISGTARAQWIVYDPANTVQSVINTAQEIAKFFEMINNQVQQIQTLTDQLNEFKQLRGLFQPLSTFTVGPCALVAALVCGAPQQCLGS